MLLALCSALLLAAAPPITVEVRPATVQLESTPTGQLLNFDLILTNTTTDPITLGALEMSVLDRSGKLALRRLINSDGFDTVSPMARQLGFKSNVLRFAYDFFRIDEAGETHRGDPEKNESWFAFGTPVHAVAPGTVVAAVDIWPDARKLDVQRLKTDRMAMFGNHVVVRHVDGAFALYAHLRQGSARCKVGDVVQAGQPLGEIGASGGAAVPHLHFQLQTAADADGEGLPSSFARYRRILGASSTRVASGRIGSGDIVESEQKGP